MMRAAFIVMLCALPAAAQPMTFEGTICRMGREAERMIIGSEAGPRLRIASDHAAVLYEGIAHDRADLRTGDRVRIQGNREGATIRATTIDRHLKVPDIVTEALFPTKTLTGRFGVREAKTEFFMLQLPGQNYLRVDAKAAYGPHGRVYVSSLKSGDLLEVRGDRPSKDLLIASYIDVITDKEDANCRENARRGESKEDTAAREAAELKFLQGGD
jgi:hypothetical protein